MRIPRKTFYLQRNFYPTRIVSLLAWLLLVVSGAKAQTNDRSLLWQISGGHLAKPSYLFGTIHLICPEDYLWTSKMNESLHKSDKICFEMDLDDPQVLMQASLSLMNTDGKKLEDYFTPEQFRLLKNYAKDSLGVDINTLQQMKPVALLSMVGTTGMNCNNPVSYEDSIMKTAEKDHKEITGLEAPKEQIDVLESIPVDTVVKQLMEALQHNAADDSEYWELIKAYKSQNLPELYRLIVNTKDLSDGMGVFLDDRNKKWIARMEDKMHNSSVFFAVGAGHLYGNNGVISLLRKQGYKVVPLR